MATSRSEGTTGKCLSILCHKFIQLSHSIKEILMKTNYNPPEGSKISVKSMLESLLPDKNPSMLEDNAEELKRVIRDFFLCCAALASSEGEKGVTLSWIPRKLSAAAAEVIKELSVAMFCGLDEINLRRMSSLGADFVSVSDERKLVVELMPTMLPLLKGVIKDSSVDATGDEVFASCARVPVASAIVAAYQFRWLVTQVEYPYLGKLCALVIPCALTSLDHWSPEVKGQAMVSFVHLAKNVNAAELGWYEDVILGAACQNIASSDELWHRVVEMSVLLVTSIHRRNPRSFWFEKILSEMLGHLERQPKNKERRIEWLQLIEPVFNAMGLLILAHFRRIFPLFFQWMHADDEQTVVLVLERVHTIIKLTWIRNTVYVERLVDELIVTYKEASPRKDREAIRARILQILVLLQQCKGHLFISAWTKHKDDPNITDLALSVSKGAVSSVVEVNN